MSEAQRPTLTRLIAANWLDAELAALLWLLADGGVPLVVASDGDAGKAEEIRSAVGGLVTGGGRTADGALPGGVARGSSLEDVLRLGGIVVGTGTQEGVPDEARDLGVVLVLDTR